MQPQLSAPQRAQYVAALGMAVLLLLTAVLASAPAQAVPLTQSFPGTVAWDSQPQIVSNGQRSGYPRVAVDVNNITHVIYATENGSIMYTNNRGGTFNLAGRALAGSSYSTTPNVAIVAGPNNTIHVAYARPDSNNRVYYRFSPDGGVTWEDQQSLSDAKAWNPDIAVDQVTGNVYIVWIDDRCGEYNVYYRVRRTNGTMTGTQAPHSECGVYQNRPAITFAIGKPHVVYQRGKTNGEIVYTRLDSGGWTQPVNISNTPTRSENATLTSDGDNGIFVAWDENTNGHDIRFIASFDNGRSWSNWVALSDSDEWASSPYATWSPRAQRVHIVWSDITGSDDGQEEIWERQFDPATLQTTAADQITHFDGHSFWPAIGVGTLRADIVWHDNVESTYQIWDWGGTVTGGDPVTGCKGTLSLAGEAVGALKATRSRTLAGTITPEAGCVPDQMQVAVNGPITDATAKLAYSANFSVQAGAGCGQTVNVRLLRRGFAAAAFNDSVIVDTGLDAFVQVTNPHLHGMPAFTGTVAGADDGARDYTREQQFLLSVEDTGDCTGLSTYQIVGGDSGVITNGSLVAWPTLANTSGAGSKSMVINVADKMNYITAFQQSIIYDSTPPVLNTSTNPTATLPLTTSSILVPLAFENITVTDDQYGPREGLPDDAEFWGVLVANSATNLPITSPALNWLPVQAPASDGFTLTWGLLSGLSDPPDRATGGDIYVYVRFIDGAGNISTDGINVQKVRLEPNYDLAALFLPMINR